MSRNLLLCLFLLFPGSLWPQMPAAAAPAPNSPATKLTLSDAIQLARANAPQFRAAVTAAGLAREDHFQARAALLPGVSYATGAIYTQPNGTPEGIFIAANGPREYLSQGAVHEGLSFSSVADLRRTGFLQALARAQEEIAARGLVTMVVQDFYGVIVSQRKAQNAQQASDEAQRFVNLSQQLEHGGEVAHADVIKAQLQANDRQRSLQEAQLAEEKARLDLAVLVFPQFTRNYELLDDLAQAPALPEFSRIQDLASHNNPELKAAMAAMRASREEVAAAIGGHLPSLSFDYFYGIDAAHYATRSGAMNNLGYEVSATLNFPIFNWGATQSRVRQAELQRDQARVELSTAQRQALANLQQFYSEAQTARAQLGILRQSSDLAADSLRLTTLRYRDGEATALEVVDAQNALVQARDNYDDGALRYRVAIANLQTLTGAF